MEKLCDFFTLQPSDLIKTLTYVLMDNFCSCFTLFLDVPGLYSRQKLYKSVDFPSRSNLKKMDLDRYKISPFIMNLY